MRRESDGTLVQHGDLRPWATWHANDMVVATNGQAYAGNFGFDLDGLYDGTDAERDRPRPPSSGSTPTGPAVRPPTDIQFPERDRHHRGRRHADHRREHGRTAHRVRSRGDGSLTNRTASGPRSRRRGAGRHLPVRGQHDLGGQRARRPSASASPRAARCSSGSRRQSNCFACMLGDDDRRTLYLVTAPTSHDVKARVERNGAIEKVRDVPCAGGGPALARADRISRAWSALRVGCARPGRCAARSR